jgi:hypothetical protein
MPTKRHYRSILAIATLAISPLVSAAAMGAQELRNPLHPSYFSAGSNAAANAMVSGTPYDSRNPLHPMHFASLSWVETGVRGSTPIYIDANNPLHPGFRRF